MKQHRNLCQESTSKIAIPTRDSRIVHKCLEHTLAVPSRVQDGQGKLRLEPVTTTHASTAFLFTCLPYQNNAVDLWNVLCDGCHNTTCEECDFEDMLGPECVPLLGGLEHASSVGRLTTLDKIKIDQGYWRATAYSTCILPCYNQGACKGGITGTAGFCWEGYQGPCE